MAKNQGKQGNALGFLMTIFQKIAASSFAAVRRTLERRIINLTVYEALLCDRNSDAAGREELLAEARSLLHRTRAIDTDILGKTEVEGILSELRFKIAKALSASDASASLKRLEEGVGFLMLAEAMGKRRPRRRSGLPFPRSESGSGPCSTNSRRRTRPRSGRWSTHSALFGHRTQLRKS